MHEFFSNFIVLFVWLIVARRNTWGFFFTFCLVWPLVLYCFNGLQLELFYFFKGITSRLAFLCFWFFFCFVVMVFVLHVAIEARSEGFGYIFLFFSVIWLGVLAYYYYLSSWQAFVLCCYCCFHVLTSWCPLLLLFSFAN